ncbi:MAG: hypothetical protein KKA65_05580, partial [Nanoarchaeota archaeon]|nr:hypothetical protein [Nanoarchaeota archaeon]MCG2720083.1 hypothetical protein [Nanoarchaeota archaeon]
ATYHGDNECRNLNCEQHSDCGDDEDIICLNSECRRFSCSSYFDYPHLDPCPDGTACGGAEYCIRTEEILDNSPEENGNLAVGETCQDGSDCASGTCWTFGAPNGVCKCNNNNDCPNGKICNAGSNCVNEETEDNQEPSVEASTKLELLVSELNTLISSMETDLINNAKKPSGTACADNTECATNNCVGIFWKRCE